MGVVQVVRLLLLVLCVVRIGSVLRNQGVLVTHQHVLLQYTGIYHAMKVPGSVLKDIVQVLTSSLLTNVKVIN